MMDVTDRHFRALCRAISLRATLWTEMVVDRTLIHNPVARGYELAQPDPLASPTVLQLGGSDPELLAEAAALSATYGFQEVNLNCGCPSPRVAGRGAFGAALMREPALVAEATRRMSDALPGTEVSVKCRLGVDDLDSYEFLTSFIDTVSSGGGVRHFIVHARKAILGGLSPAQNRTIPPLKHEFVYRLMDDFPHLTFTLNGGVREVADCVSHLDRGVAGVMVGRGVWDRPWHALRDVDELVYGEGRYITRRDVVEKYADYAEEEQERSGTPNRCIVKPVLNLFHGEASGKKFRREIDDQLKDKEAGIRDILEAGLAVMKDEVVDALPPSVAAREVAEAKESVFA